MLATIKINYLQTKKNFSLKFLVKEYYNNSSKTVTINMNYGKKTKYA